MMQRKNLIKSIINVNQKIQVDFQKCLKEYLNQKQINNSMRFQTQIVKSSEQHHKCKFKKTLLDWRSIYPEPKFKMNYLESQSQVGKQNLMNLSRKNKLSFTRSIFSTNSLKKKDKCSSDKGCRKKNSSFSNSNHGSVQQVFQQSLTPFALVQNIYSVNVKNFQQQKRPKTARIRQYYQKKASKFQQFQIYDKMQLKINQKQLNLNVNVNDYQKQFVKTRRNFLTQRKKPQIFQKKNNRIIIPNQYFRLQNKIKIPQNSIIRQCQKPQYYKKHE